MNPPSRALVFDIEVTGTEPSHMGPSSDLSQLTAAISTRRFRAALGIGIRAAPDDDLVFYFNKLPIGTCLPSSTALSGSPIRCIRMSLSPMFASVTPQCFVTSPFYRCKVHVDRLELDNLHCRYVHFATSSLQLGYFYRRAPTELAYLALIGGSTHTTSRLRCATTSKQEGKG